ncbi:hypothetical protein ACFYXS_26610 [Streptomyces sp. NPDC002574]|uniref:hypothetical protein n=1 Tax=Streptomyces sp. NPDC002574 TaxID=3364652 RepID=UPI00368BB5A5
MTWSAAGVMDQMTWYGHALRTSLSAGFSFFTIAWIIFMITSFHGARALPSGRVGTGVDHRYPDSVTERPHSIPRAGPAIGVLMFP